MSEQDENTTTPDPAETATTDGQNTTQETPGITQGIQGGDTDTGKPKGGNDALKADLVRERRQRQALEKRLKDIEDRDLTELQRAQKQAQESTARLAQLESEAMRQRVALKAGIPPEHIHRLQGTTEDELAADAAELVKLLAPKGPRPDPSQGSRGGQTGPPTMNDYIHGLLKSR